MLDSLIMGFSVALTVNNLWFCLAGVTIGTLVGVLPGLGPLAAISMLLPLSYNINDPVTSIIFLAGIYYGTQYGGSTTSILLRLPGEASSVITTLDGHAMTQQGRGGAALAIAALSSFLAGTVATVLIATAAVPLAEVAIKFGAADYTALMVMALLMSVTISQGSFARGLAMVCFGVLLGLIGTDVNSGVARFTFDIPNLMDGISFGIVAMGMIGLSEILFNAMHVPERKFTRPSVRELYPSRAEFSQSWPAALRGTGVGSFLGFLPGGGAIMASFASYALEKRISSQPDKFGQGAPQGVAAPEAANNAAAQTSFIPTLSLGLPTTPVMALMIGALMINNIQPGPQTISHNPELFWGLIASMWLGNLLLLILNLPLVGIWIRVIELPRKVLYPLIVVACAYGAYYINNSWFDVWLLIPFTVMGYVLRRLDCEPAPLAIGFVVGVYLEEYLRRALTISRGDFSVFIDRPISLAFLTLAVVLIAAKLYTEFKKR